MKKGIWRFLGVVLVTALLLCFFSVLLKPTWVEWNNDNTLKGIYEEPKNRLQVVFLGTSQVANGIAPVELYTRYGICAYNMGTQQQPLLSSYYWLKEIHRLHKETLSTVVLDISFIYTHETEIASKVAFNEKALTGMRLSPVKLEALKACAEQYEDFKVIDHLFPLIRYHSRWASVSSNDFSSLTDRDNRYFTRGQNLDFSLSLDDLSDSSLRVPQYELTGAEEYTLTDYEKEWDARNREIVDSIAAYCREQGLNLILLKIPKATSDLQHDAISYLAKEYGVPFIDLNQADVQEKMGFQFAYDYTDAKHPNVSGAVKITDYLGSYIKEHYPLDDVRTDSRYDYLKEQAEEYQVVLEDEALTRCEKLGDYLKLLDRDRYTVFLVVRDDATRHLTEKNRSALVKLGFKGFKKLGYRCGYVGIRDRGKILLDVASADPLERLSVDGTMDIDRQYTLNAVYRQLVDETGALTEEPDFLLLTGKNTFSLESAGYQAGKYGRITINGVSRSDNNRGLNFVVYDNDLKAFVDHSSFDTFVGGSRRSDLQLSTTYQSRLEGAKLAAGNTVREYMELAGAVEHSTVILIGTMMERTPLLSGEDSRALSDLGLREIGKIEEQPYAAMIRNGRVLWETSVPADQSLLIESVDEELINYSVSKEPGANLAITIGDTSYNVPENRIYALTYSASAGRTLNTKTFDLTRVDK